MTGRLPSCSCGECRKCQRNTYMREWYRKKTAERGSPATGHRNPEVARRSDAKRSGSETRRASLASGAKRQRDKNPEKYRARYTLTNAVRDGRVTKQPCTICGKGKVEAHHPDYTKPLEVLWFCRPHHKAHHGHLRPDYPL